MYCYCEQAHYFKLTSNFELEYPASGAEVDLHGSSIVVFWASVQVVMAVISMLSYSDSTKKILFFAGRLPFVNMFEETIKRDCQCL